MDSNTPQSQENLSTPPMQKSKPANGSAGPLVGIIVVIALLAFGAFYFWQQSSQNETQELPYIPGDDTLNESWKPAGTGSDDAAAIEAELEATNMSDFEALMNADASATDAAL